MAGTMAARRSSRSGSSKGRGSTRGRATTDSPSFLGRLVGVATGPRTIVAFKAVAWIGGAVLLGWGIAAGIPELERRAEARDLERISTIAVEFAQSPDWFRTDPDLRPTLEGTVAAAIGIDRASVSDREGLIAAREALADSGWFEAVTQVRWIGPGRVQVEADWVVPAAVVHGLLDGEPKDVPVDRRGRRLPYAFDPGMAMALPRIVSPRVRQAPRIGEFWGEDVGAGISLHALMRSHPWYDQVRSVDLSNFGKADGLVLRTDDCSIVWGLPPDSNSLGEPPAADKLYYLDALVEKYGRIDTHCLGGRISLPADVVTYRATTCAR
jgi:hypothetical protein